jgi:hypothetical protein
MSVISIFSIGITGNTVRYSRVRTAPARPVRPPVCSARKKGRESREVTPLS